MTNSINSDFFNKGVGQLIALLLVWEDYLYYICMKEAIYCTNGLFDYQGTAFFIRAYSAGSGRLCGVEPAHYQEYRGGKSKSFRRDALEDRRGTRTGVAVESKGSG